MSAILGLHHVTAIASNPQRNHDFYTGVLGLRRVKLTVNFDDPGTYHFYFGDEQGTPGSIMTFFPWPNAVGGRHGTGQVAVTSFAILPAAMGFWIERLLRYGVKYDGPTRRTRAAQAESVVSFRDPDGTMLELVGHPSAEGRPSWGGAPGIRSENAIHGFHGVTLWVERGEPTARVLVDTMGFREAGEDESTRRYVVGDGGASRIVDVREIGSFGRGNTGAGCVHHVAFAVADDDAELAMRKRVADAGLHPTPVVDRNYFHSVYFREPGGVLYELATLPPGFTADEPLERLGERLMLPPQYESRREELEQVLPPLEPIARTAST
jgi:glyoxalase family protein